MTAKNPDARLPPDAPRLVKTILQHPDNEAWLVGGAALPGADLSAVKDWDIIVPLCVWGRLAGMLAQHNPVPNSFGGWRILLPEGDIDIWPDDLSNHAMREQFRAAWNPARGIRLVRYKTSHVAPEKEK